MRETFDTGIQKKYENHWILMETEGVVTVVQRFHFSVLEKSIRIYVLKHKSMLQIDFGPKSGF